MKERLDAVLVARGLATDVESARRSIGAGEVYVNDAIVDKAGSKIADNAVIRFKKRLPFVSRGGLKLAHALQYFSINPKDRICLDIGASTGGFTDCLLQNGAGQVYAVDVAYGQLAWKLRQDKRVIAMERCNARLLPSDTFVGKGISLAVTDVSFISLKKILPILFDACEIYVDVVALIKPQFELPRDDVQGGVVCNPALHEKAIESIISFVGRFSGLEIDGIVKSPIYGANKKNTEFLIHIISKKGLKR